MSKKLGPKEDVRVVIRPRGLGYGGFFSIADFRVQPDPYKRGEEYEAACRSIKEEVMRHVDGVGSVDIEFHREYICEHCAARWSEDADDYNGGCCEKDEEAHMAKQEAA